MSRATLLIRSLRWLCTLLVFVTACTVADSDTGTDFERGTETGNPPVINGSLLKLVVRGDRMEIAGSPGAVLPGGSTLVVVDAKTKVVLESLPTNDDGSFSTVLARVDKVALRAENEFGSSEEEPAPPPSTESAASTPMDPGTSGAALALDAGVRPQMPIRAMSQATASDAGLLGPSSGPTVVSVERDGSVSRGDGGLYIDRGTVGPISP